MENSDLRAGAGAGELWSFTLDDVLDVELGHPALAASVTATSPLPVVRAELSVD